MISSTEMSLDSKIYVAGHQGLVGSALMRLLSARGYNNLITCSFEELDLRNQNAVNNFFATERPEYVFLAAAHVGGIQENVMRPAEFIYDNLAIELHVIHAASIYKVKKLLFLGSSCIYPRDCQQPIKEEYFLSGYLEKTNAPYAIAKIAGIGMCQSYNAQYGTNFISVMPTNLYGPGDTFNRISGHVIAALITTFNDALRSDQKHVIVGGSGSVYREFLYIDDCADALIFLMNTYSDSAIINIGTGEELTIYDLVMLISTLMNFDGGIQWDTSFPEGTPRKRLDIHRLKNLGWQAKTSLQSGLTKTIDWYKQHYGGN